MSHALPLLPGSHGGRAARTVLALAITLAALPAAAQTRAFVGARVVDGTGAVIERAAIVVRDDTIVRVGPVAEVPIPDGAERIDVEGATIIPGLINAHGHLTSADGMRTVGYTRENLIRQLRTYARYGVTTVFSLGDDQKEAFALRDEQRRGTWHGARLFVAGPVITGTTAEEARRMTDEVAAMRPDLIKLRIDDNLGTGRKMPEPAWRAAISGARERALPVAVHIFYLADAKAALAAGASIIAHSVRDLPVDDEFIDEMKERDACYVPTLMREVSTFIYGHTPPWVNDPFFLEGAGEGVAAELSDPARQAAVRASGAYQQGLRYKEALEIARRNLTTLADAGVRIAMGTDSGPPGRWQGFFEHLELEMMVASGMTPMQAIVSATGAAAACHGRTGEFGAIVPGASADLLVLDANPLDDIRNTRRIRSVWIAGRRVN